MVTPPVVIVGGGMITHDQLLPSAYQLQRLGWVGEITVCARTARTLEALAGSATLRRAFPDRSFRACAGGYRDALAGLPAGSLAVVAVPDHVHYEVIMAALAAGHHVCAVKPLVLKAAQALEIETEARSRGLLVGVEYHKRFDDRALLARRMYREGKFGELRLGAACLLEKWYYRHSNFQNWCTVENSDAFTYIGCHYVDLVHFITGLLPVSVSVHGVRDHYPNGNEGFLWTDARVVWNNGACLNVQNAIGFPDAAPGTNTQGLTLYCSGAEGGALISHSDQYRGVAHVYDGGSYAEPSPDYFQYLDFGGPGLAPVGYGYRSVEYILLSAIRLERDGGGLAARRRLLASIDETGIMATPANSRYNELVVEAGRLSILNGGRSAAIEYGEPPSARLA
jgi:predicted dehydrogenase